MRRRELALTAALLLVAAVVWAVEEVGQVAWVRGELTRSRPGEGTKVLSAGDRFALGDTLRTGVDAAARLSFTKHGSLELGSAESQTITEATLEKVEGGQGLIRLLKGWLTIALDELFGGTGELRVETPSASIGIKGTLVVIWVDEAGGTWVMVIEVDLPLGRG